ncbi:MAG: hypothetical protein IPG42_10720 [Betaproteobacteria bacterium]|nr:hypothetical protein [Betaproteobacteria bacterium]
MLLASLDELRQAGLDPQLLRPNVRFAEVARLGGHGQLLIDGQAITLDMPVYQVDLEQLAQHGTAGVSSTSPSQGDADLPDAQALLSAEQMARHMQCTPPAVYDREKAGEFLAVMPPGRLKGRKFPGFQLHPRLDKSLLKELIAAYRGRGVSLNQLWSFLRTVQNDLEGGSALEVLLGDYPPTLKALDESRRRRFILDMALEDIARTY